MIIGHNETGTSSDTPPSFKSRLVKGDKTKKPGRKAKLLDASSKLLKQVPTHGPLEEKEFSMEEGYKIWKGEKLIMKEILPLIDKYPIK